MLIDVSTISFFIYICIYTLFKDNFKKLSKHEKVFKNITVYKDRSYIEQRLKTKKVMFTENAREKKIYCCYFMY